MVRYSLLAAALVAGTLRAVPAGAAPVDGLLGKVLDAYGGVKALERVAVVEERGKVHSKVRHPGQAGELVRIFQGADRLRVEVAYPDGEREVRILAGDRGWRDGEEAVGPLLASMQVQAARLALPLVLHQRRAALVEQGEVERDGMTLRQVSLPMAGGTALTVEIDPATGHIVRSAGTVPMRPMGSVEFQTTYDDFRKVGAVLFPFHEGNYASGRHTADTVLASVKLLDKAAPATFGPGDGPLQAERLRFLPARERLAWRGEGPLVTTVGKRR